MSRTSPGAAPREVSRRNDDFHCCACELQPLGVGSALQRLRPLRRSREIALLVGQHRRPSTTTPRVAMPGRRYCPGSRRPPRSQHPDWTTTGRWRSRRPAVQVPLDSRYQDFARCRVEVEASDPLRSVRASESSAPSASVCSTNRGPLQGLVGRLHETRARRSWCSLCSGRHGLRFTIRIRGIVSKVIAKFIGLYIGRSILSPWIRTGPYLPHLGRPRQLSRGGRPPARHQSTVSRPHPGPRNPAGRPPSSCANRPGQPDAGRAALRASRGNR